MAYRGKIYPYFVSATYLRAFSCVWLSCLIDVMLDGSLNAKYALIDCFLVVHISLLLHYSLSFLTTSLFVVFSSSLYLFSLDCVRFSFFVLLLSSTASTFPSLYLPSIINQCLSFLLRVDQTYRLVAIDIDGTLMNDRKEITVATREALERVRRAGAL